MTHESDTAYQIKQSLYSIGSGGLSGVGFGESRQKYMFLPEEHNDFICYRKVSGWTHDWPALIYSFTDISLFFYDENAETVENVENEAGIDAYEDRVGYFCVRPEDYVLAMNQIEDHDVRGVEH